LDLNVGSGVVLHDDEDGCQGRCHLEHEPQDEDHGHTGHDISMVLNHELVAEKWGVLGLLLHHDGSLTTLTITNDTKGPTALNRLQHSTKTLPAVVTLCTELASDNC